MRKIDQAIASKTASPAVRTEMLSGAVSISLLFLVVHTGSAVTSMVKALNNGGGGEDQTAVDSGFAYVWNGLWVLLALAAFGLIWYSAPRRCDVLQLASRPVSAVAMIFGWILMIMVGGGLVAEIAIRATSDGQAVFGSGGSMDLPAKMASSIAAGICEEILGVAIPVAS